MKLIFTAFCAFLLTSPLSFAEEGKCDKCPGDKKDESTIVACDKCEKHAKKDAEEEKKESTLAGKDCKGGKCDKDEDESTLAGKDCKGGKCDKDEDESTLAA